MNYDVIVIGAGLGGLTAGAKLATEGKKVLLVEQHSRPGGCATTFRRNDFTLEVGLHEMDGLHPRDIKVRIFDELGISGKVEFLPVPEFYRFINDKHDLVVPHDPETARSILKNKFPMEEKGIEDYFYHVLNARKIMVANRGKEDRSVGEFLDDIINDDDLKLVLLGNLGYFHDDPYSLSWIYYLTAQGSYYGGRANYVKGGSQKLSDSLSEVITRNGGDVKLNHLVTSIDYNGQEPVGITYKGLRGKDKGASYSDTSHHIVVNAALPNLAESMLSKDDGKRLAYAVEGQNIGASLLTVYYGFKKPLKEVGNRHYSTFVYDSSVKSPKDILENNKADFNRRSFTFVDYSQLDSNLAPEGKSVGAVCCIDYPSDWEDLSSDDYNTKKAEIAEIFTDRCEQLIPEFRNAIEFAEVATSLTVTRYTLNPKGAVYGFAQNPGRSSAYLNAMPENIHIASAWGKYGGGFSGAIISGYMTAVDIIRKFD